MRRKQFIALLMATAVVSQSSFLMAGEQVVNTEVSVSNDANETDDTVVELLGGKSGETMIDVALETNPTQDGEKLDMKNEYISQQGEITEINKEGDYYNILVGTPIDGTVYIVEGSEIIIEAATLGYLAPSDLKVGMNITVIVPKNAPMTMSLPAKISDQVAIIVNSDEATTNMSYFNEELVNEENTLQLNVGRETYITNTTGERRIFTGEDIQNHSAVVIYTITTRSIPAQTNPKMVLILPNSEELSNEEETRNTSSVEEVCDLVAGSVENKSVAVRDLAEAYGYEVKWNHETKSATLTKGENTIVVTLGKVEVKHNNTVCTFQEAAKMENQKLIVSNELENLL